MEQYADRRNAEGNVALPRDLANEEHLTRISKGARGGSSSSWRAPPRSTPSCGRPISSLAHQLAVQRQDRVVVQREGRHEHAAAHRVAQELLEVVVHEQRVGRPELPCSFQQRSSPLRNSGFSLLTTLLRGQRLVECSCSYANASSRPSNSASSMFCRLPQLHTATAKCSKQKSRNGSRCGRRRAPHSGSLASCPSACSPSAPVCCPACLLCSLPLLLCPSLCPVPLPLCASSPAVLCFSLLLSALPCSPPALLPAPLPPPPYGQIGRASGRERV